MVEIKDYRFVRKINYRYKWFEGLPEGLADGSEDGLLVGLPDSVKSRLFRLNDYRMEVEMEEKEKMHYTNA